MRVLTLKQLTPIGGGWSCKQNGALLLLQLLLLLCCLSVSPGTQAVHAVQQSFVTCIVSCWIDEALCHCTECSMLIAGPRRIAATTATAARLLEAAGLLCCAQWFKQPFIDVTSLSCGTSCGTYTGVGGVMHEPRRCPCPMHAVQQSLVTCIAGCWLDETLCHCTGCSMLIAGSRSFAATTATAVD